MFKRKILVSLVAAATLAAGSPSFARGDDDRGHRHHHQHHQRDGWNDRRDDGRYAWRDDRRDDFRDERHRRGWERGRGHDVQVKVVRQGPRWHRGDRLPQAYRNPRYVVHDWRAHRLSAPPRGQQWMHVDAGFVLVAAATGIITQLILNQ